MLSSFQNGKHVCVPVALIMRLKSHLTFNSDVILLEFNADNCIFCFYEIEVT